jgi:hypothetical protein
MAQGLLQLLDCCSDYTRKSGIGSPLKTGWDCGFPGRKLRLLTYEDMNHPNRSDSGFSSHRTAADPPVSLTLSRSVGALVMRDETFVASQLPPSTHVTIIQPGNERDGLVAVETEDGVKFLVFACDLKEDQSSTPL